MTIPADTLYTNGHIYTMNPRQPVANTLATNGKNILYVGNDPHSVSLAPGVKPVDLRGGIVVPGLIDAHMHVMALGNSLLALRLYNLNKNDILEAVRREAQKLPKGEWLTGMGWNQELWTDKAWPCKDELDEVAPHNPVALDRWDGHALWANSLALQAAGITAESHSPMGGEIFKKPDGSLQGILTDTAVQIMWNAAPPMSDARLRLAVLKMQEKLFSYGITSVCDAYAARNYYPPIITALQSGELKLRIYGLTPIETGQEHPVTVLGTKPVIGAYDEHLTMRAAKLLSDGSLGSRSAWLTHDYADRPGHVGNARYNNEQLVALVTMARKNGFQMCIHAIGNAAVKQCMGAMKKVLSAYPGPDHRFRIEHFQIASESDFIEAGKLGVIPAMQCAHLISDLNMVDKRLDAELSRTAYAWKSAIRHCGLFAGGSDAPMGIANPFHGMYAAVTRADLDGNPKGGWHPQQCITREEALKSYTTWAAYSQFEENRKGSLESGKLADFAVLDRDILTCTPEALKDTRVIMTVSGGEEVYRL